MALLKILYLISHSSFINKIELLSNPKLSKTEEKSINLILDYINILDYNNAIGDHAISFRKKYKLQLADSIIAGTTAFLNIPLLTADKEFIKIKELDIVIFEI
jgi:predicted nucleic acid-binding protein